MVPATHKCNHSDLDTTTTSTSSNNSGASVSTLSDLSMETLKKQFINYASVDGRFTPRTPPETLPEMPQKETSPVQSCNKSAKCVSCELTKKSDAEPSCSYTVSSDVSGRDSRDSDVDLYDIRESEGDISDDELVAAYDGQEVQEVSYVRSEALNEEALGVVAVYDGRDVEGGKVVLSKEVPDVVDATHGQEVEEVGDEGKVVLSEEVPDVVDATHGQEVKEVGDEGKVAQDVQEVGDARIEGINEEAPAVVDPNDGQEVQDIMLLNVADGQVMPEISDVGTRTVDCEVFEEVVCDNAYREADFSTSGDSSVTPFMAGTPSWKTGTPKPWFLHGPDILQKPLCKLEIRQRWLTMNIWKKEVFYKYETYGPPHVSSEAAP